MPDLFITLNFCTSFIPVWGMYVDHITAKHNRDISHFSQMVLLKLLYKNSFGCPEVAAAMLRKIIKSNGTISDPIEWESKEMDPVKEILNLQQICNN